MLLRTGSVHLTFPPGRYLLKVPGEHPLPPDYEDVLASNLAFRLLFDEATEKDSEDNADT